jgi:hypothetical protein
MIKKILGIGLLVGFTGVLIAGAVNRTLAKSGENEHVAIERQDNSGQANRGSGGGFGNGNGQATHDDSEGFGGKQEQQFQLSQGNGYRAGGQAVGQGGGLTQAVEGTSLEGVVASLDDISLQVTLADGNVLELVDRPWRFALESGFSAQPGDALRLTGFYDDYGVFEVSQLENLSSGQTTYLRDESGRPLWAGRNRIGA